MTAANAPGTEPARAPERVVLDATVVVTPDLDTGLALLLEAGHLTVRARLASEALHEPVYLIFRGYRDADPSALIEFPISRAGESTSTRHWREAGPASACCSSSVQAAGTSSRRLVAARTR